MYLFHNYRETITILDAEGRSYRIPANEPWEVPEIKGTDCNGTQAYNPFVISAAEASKIFCKEGIHYGLVPVPEKRGPRGIVFDIEEASIASKRVRKASEDAILDRYIRGAKEDELAKLPVKPPSASIAKIIDSRGLDLKRDYGLQPVGYRVSEAAAARDAEMEALRSSNSTMSREMGELKEMLAMLLDDKKEKAAKEKGKEKVGA